MKSKIIKVYKSQDPAKLAYYNSLAETEKHQCNRCKKIFDPLDKETKMLKNGWNTSVCKSCGCSVFLKVKIIDETKTV